MSSPIGWSVNAVVPRSDHLLLNEPCSTFTTGCCTLWAAPFPESERALALRLRKPVEGGN